MSDFYDEYYCPNCDAILNEQIGFDPNAGVWTCTECGKTLFGDDVEKTQDQFDGVVWYCDSCGAVLSMQDGFDDSCESWECAECGEINSITSDNIFESHSDYDLKSNSSQLENDASFEDTEEDDDDDYDDEDDYDQDENNSESNIDAGEDDECKNSQCETLYSSDSYRAQPLPGLKKIWYHLVQKKLEAGVSSQKCIDVDFKKVVSWLLNSGFRQVHTVPVEELTMKEIKHEGLVKSVSINGHTSFDTRSKFPFNSKIIVRYYVLKRVNPPFSSSHAKGKNYMDVISAFRHAGFSSIETRVIYDLVLGWLKKDGAVEQISINDCNKFGPSTLFRLDAKITITYHTFRKYRI